MGCHHLVNVTNGSAKHEDAGANYSDEAAVEAGKRGNEATDREPQARRAYLELEGAVSPADKRRRDLAEEHVENEVDENMTPILNKTYQARSLSTTTAPVTGRGPRAIATAEAVKPIKRKEST